MNAGSLANALVASVHALRSYQHGNSAPDLAASIADAGVAALRAAGHGGLLLLTQADATAVNRQHGLSVEILEGRLVIAIGVEADILSALHDEEDDGTTLVHVMLDTATEKALDGGSLHVTFDGDEDGD